MIKKSRASKAAGLRAAAAPKLNEASSKNKTSIYLVLLAIVILTALALMINQKIKARQKVVKPATPVTVSQGEQANKPLDKSDISALIARVGSLIVINANEEPTIATVQDADALRQSNPVFYKDAINGDRLLVWSDKAVLYSLQMDKLLAVMPILGGQTDVVGSATSTSATASSTVSTVESEKATVEVRNGTTTPGLARIMANLLRAENVRIILVGDAKSKAFEKTVILVLSSKPLPATLAVIQEVTKAEVRQPTDEEAKGYKSDFVVIVGKDFVKP